MSLQVYHDFGAASLASGNTRQGVVPCPDSPLFVHNFSASLPAQPHATDVDSARISFSNDPIVDHKNAMSSAVLERIRAALQALPEATNKHWTTLEGMPYIHATDAPNASPFGTHLVGRFDFFETVEYMLACNPLNMRLLLDHIEDLQDDIQDKQATIDSLMLEFSPPEMAREQAEEWGRRKRPVSPDRQAIINEAVRTILEVRRSHLEGEEDGSSAAVHVREPLAWMLITRQGRMVEWHPDAYTFDPSQGSLADMPSVADADDPQNAPHRWAQVYAR